LSRIPTGTPVRDSPASEPERTRRSPRSAAWFLAPFAVFSLLGLLWALGSPVFSVPDENAHATKAIAQVRGQVVGYTLPGVRHIIVDLPPGYQYSPEMLCFTTHSETPASCAPALGDPGGQDWFNTWVGAYNPVYYTLVGWPSLLFDGNASVYAMRVASVLLGAALLAWAFQAAVLGRRAGWMPLGVAFVAAPMSLYLVGAVNPNGAELAAAVAIWVGVLRLLETFRPASEQPLLSRTWLWGGVTVAGVVLVNARALGPLWLVIIVGACFLASGWAPVKALFTTGASYAWLAIIAAGGVFSVGWTLTGGSLSGQADAADAPLVGGTFLQGFLHTIRGTNDYMHQAIGFFGWMDAPLPVWAYWFFIAAFAVLVVLAATATRRRSVLVLVAVVFAAIVVPALVQGASVNQTGIIWQGRYALFLYLGITIVAGWLLSRDAARIDFLAPRITWVGASLIGAYGVIAYALVMVRYVIGGEASLGEMVSAPQWQPPLGWPALTIGYTLASLALVALVGVAGTVIARSDRPWDGPAAAREAESTPARG
jgi:hypothetical protein